MTPDKQIEEKQTTLESVPGRKSLLPRSFSEAQESFLKQKTPAKFIKRRPGPGGLTLSYVDIGYVTNMLNGLFGYDWDFIIEDQQVGKTQVWCKGKLVVRAGDKQIIKSQYGGSDIKFNRNGDMISVADDLKAAASDCLKKCASMLGIASDVYYPQGVADE